MPATAQGANLDLFYDGQNRLKAGFITRAKSSDRNLAAVLGEGLSKLESRENLVQFEDRYLFIIKRPVKVGSAKDKRAFLYLALDIARMTDERRKLLKKAKKEKLPLDDVFFSLEDEGLFAVLSGNDYPTDEILPAYYQRQAAEQIFDFAKNYTKLLTLRIHTEETLSGHLLLSFIATIAVKLIHIGLKSEEDTIGSRLSVMRNQKCTVYSSKAVTDTPCKQVNDVYKAFGIDCPASFGIIGGRAIMDTDPKRKAKKKKEARTEAEEPKKKRGRPAGIRNRKPLERLEAEKRNPPEKKKRGRPKGSKNKPNATEVSTPEVLQPDG